MAGKGKYYESQFEEATIELLRESHWQYTFGDDIHRKYTDPLIEEDLRTFLAAQYKDKKLTASEVDGIVANLRNTGGQNDYYALQNTFLLYRDGYDFTYSDGRGNPFRLQYIDFEHPDHNIFRCVNQFVMEQGRENRRPDILLFVNGIPVCIVELKNPTKQNATIRDAHTQICTRYMRDIPALLKYCALAVISDGAKNELGTTYTPFEFFYEWKKIDNEDKAGKGLDTLRTLIRGALSPERILEILRDYVYFPDPSKEDDTTEIVCRYPQFLPLVSYETISSLICVLLAAMARVVPISVPPGAERHIPCCSLLASWHFVAESSWAVPPFSSLLTGKIWRHKAENSSAARSASLRMRPSKCLKPEKN